MKLTYSTFHKTLPNSSLQMHWISVRFYEMGVITVYRVSGWQKRTDVVLTKIPQNFVLRDRRSFREAW